MHKVIHYLLKHKTENPNRIFWLFFVAFLGVSILVRYSFGVAPVFENWSFRWFWGLLFYAVPFFCILLVYATMNGKSSFWKEKRFWILSGMILLVLVNNQYLFRMIWEEIALLFAPETHIFVQALFFNLHSSFFYLIIPLLYASFFQEIHSTKFYGCTTENYNPSLYFGMLLGMSPLLLWASFRVDFLEAYPRYKYGAAEEYWQISAFWTVLGYELSYILQFISLEIFFRGFIVMSLSRYIGSGSVYVMVGVYVFLHFFKPMPETVGSAFGGYILGVIAYYSRSVVGGMVVHIGIALLMELLAFGQKINFYFF